MITKKSKASITVNVLIKKEDNAFVAHCLELDIVTTGDNIDQVTQDITDLVKAQIEYAFTNDNLDYLYHPAPQEVWKEFYACNGHIERRNKIESKDKTDQQKVLFLNSGFFPVLLSYDMSLF